MNSTRSRQFLFHKAGATQEHIIPQPADLMRFYQILESVEATMAQTRRLRLIYDHKIITPLMLTHKPLKRSNRTGFVHFSVRSTAATVAYQRDSLQTGEKLLIVHMFCAPLMLCEINANKYHKYCGVSHRRRRRRCMYELAPVT